MGIDIYERFKSEGAAIVTKMANEKLIYSAGFGYQGCPTREERLSATANWKVLVTEMMGLCVDLFREIGGNEAIRLMREVFGKAETEWGGGVSGSYIVDDPVFLQELLGKSTQKL